MLPTSGLGLAATTALDAGRSSSEPTRESGLLGLPLMAAAILFAKLRQSPDLGQSAERPDKLDRALRVCLQAARR